MKSDAQLNDDQIIDAALGGDSEAYGLLVLRYQDRLYNSLVRVVGCAEEAKDVTQEAFVRALVKLDTFRGTSAFYTWLYRIAFNLALSGKRRAKPTDSIDFTKETVGAEPIDPTAGPEKQLHQNEQAYQVQQALATIDEQHRNILVLKEIEGYEYEAIADLLKIPVGTVRSRLYRARMAFKTELERVMEEKQSNKTGRSRKTPK